MSTAIPTTDDLAAWLTWAAQECRRKAPRPPRQSAARPRIDHLAG